MHRKIPIGIDLYIYREGLKISKFFRQPPPEKKAMNYWLRKCMKSRKILKYLFWQKKIFLNKP